MAKSWIASTWYAKWWHHTHCKWTHNSIKLLPYAASFAVWKQPLISRQVSMVTVTMVTKYDLMLGLHKGSRNMLLCWHISFVNNCICAHKFYQSFYWVLQDQYLTSFWSWSMKKLIVVRFKLWRCWLNVEENIKLNIFARMNTSKMHCNIFEVCKLLQYHAIFYVYYTCSFAFLHFTLLIGIFLPRNLFFNFTNFCIQNVCITLTKVSI